MNTLSPTSYHLVGVAGVGMSALAQALRGEGVDVSGSDRHLDHGENQEVLERLRRAGVELVPQDGSGVRDARTTVVLSTAIEETNPDLQAARTKGCAIQHRAEVLAGLTSGHACVGVAGTSGKTTVTGMLGWILEQAGREPTVVNGGAVLGWVSEARVGNVRLGSSDLWVVETDESDRSFLRFAPDWSVITNITLDHFSLDELVVMFTQYARQTRRGVLCGPGVRTTLGDMEPELAARCEDVSYETLSPQTFRFHGQTFTVPALGAHNVENAACAVAVSEKLGVNLDAAAAALQDFPGIHRRLEIVGSPRGMLVLDDYAHNPAKIAAAWRAAASRAERVLGVWRPHGFAPLAAFAGELVETFHSVLGDDDELYVLPVYYAGGTTQRSLTSADFVMALQEAGVAASWASDYDALEAGWLGRARPGDALLFMGARDPDLPRRSRQLAQRLAKRAD